MTITKERLLDGEKFIPIPDFPNYFVSNFGRILSIWENGYHKILKGGLDGSGYLVYELKHYSGNAKRMRGHRAVGVAFGLGTWADIYNHKDGNKINNSLDNIEVTTHHENIKHAYKTGLKTIKGENHPGHKLNLSDIKKIKLLAEYGVTPNQLANVFSVSTPTINDLLRGRTWYRSSVENRKRPLCADARNKKAIESFKKESESP